MNRDAPQPLALALTQLRARWLGLSGRERRLAGLAVTAVALLLLWWIALAPALRTLQAGEQRRESLDLQQRRMLSLRAEAQRLQSQPRIGAEDAARALDAAVRQGLSGTAQMAVAGDRATITLRGTPADVLAAWLVQVRTNARALPLEAHLVRSTAPPPAPGTPPPGMAGGGVGPTSGMRTPAAPAGPTPQFALNAPAPVVTAPPAGAVTVAPSLPDVRWDGTLVLGLPSR